MKHIWGNLLSILVCFFLTKTSDIYLVNDIHKNIIYVSFFVIYATVALLIYWRSTIIKKRFQDLKAIINGQSKLGKKLESCLRGKGDAIPSLNDIISNPDLTIKPIKIKDKVNNWIVQAAFFISDNDNNLLFYSRPSAKHPTNRQLRKESCLQSINLMPTRHGQEFDINTYYTRACEMLMTDKALCEQLGVNCDTGITMESIKEAIKFTPACHCCNEVAKDKQYIYYIFYIYHLEFTNISCHAYKNHEAVRKFVSKFLNIGIEETMKNSIGFKNKSKQETIRENIRYKQLADNKAIEYLWNLE